MAAQVEVQSAEVGRTVVGGRLHLTPLADSSNSLIEIPSIGQSRIITPEPGKPVPGPKPRLTPKPFAVERSTTIKPIVAPKPQTKPRPETTLLPGHKPEPSCTPKPQQPVSTPRPVSSGSKPPASTSFKTSNKLIAGQTTKPVVQPFKAAPPFDPGDPSKPAEREKPASLSLSHSLEKLPAAEWSGTTNKEAKDQLTSGRGGPSITRAKSMGFLSEAVKEEEEKKEAKPEAPVPLRPKPRPSRPRPVSALFLDSPAKTEPPVPVPRWAGRRPLSADLTSKFESIGLSLHRKTPKESTKENTPEETVPPQKTETTTSQSPEAAAAPAASDQSSKKPEVTVKESEEAKRALNIKSRIGLPDPPSSPMSTGQESDLHSAAQPVPEPEPAVGVKQLIKQLTEDTPPTQSPVLKPPVKPRPLPLDLTRRFSSESVVVSEATDRHDIISKDPQRRIEESSSSPSVQATFVDLKDTHVLSPGVPEAGQVHSAKGGGDVQTVRASLFENVVERHNVLMVDEGKPASKAKNPLSSPSIKKGNGEDKGTLVTATYKEPASPSSPLRVLHAFDMVPAVEESRVVSENIPSAQWEDKATTLRTRRSEGNRQPPPERTGEQPPRYLRVGALQKWNTTGLDLDASIDKGMKEPAAPEKPREAEQEEVAAAPKRLKMLQGDEQAKPRATYFALTGQIQEPLSPRGAAASAGSSEDFSVRSAPGSSQGKTPPVRRNPSLKEAFGQTSQGPGEESIEVEKKREVEERATAKMKELERERQRQLEMEKAARLEFERMKEKEAQREFERQRQKAFEKEKQEHEEKQRALARQKQVEQELQRQAEKENQRKIEREKLQEQERERQRQKEEERQRELERERRLLEIKKEKQRMEELERVKELERQQLIEFQKQKQKEMERQQLMELEKQRLREKKEKEEAEKLKQIALEQEMLRLREIEKERERQREMERETQKELERQRQRELERERQRQLDMERQRQLDMERQRQLDMERERQLEMERQKQLEMERQRQFDMERQRQIEMERQRQLDMERQRQLDMERQELENQRLRQRELEKERQRKEEQERIKEMERRQLLEFEKQKQAERDRQQMELERRRLREEAERQKKEEQERARLESAALRPTVVDLDSVVRNQPFPKAAYQRSDPATRWKEPTESYKPAILDIDAFSSQAQPSPGKDLFPAPDSFGARPQPTPERDISWRVPAQTSAGFTSPVWTLSPQDPWELQPVEMSVDQPVAAELGKQANKPSPEQLLLRQEERLQSPQRHWSSMLDEPLHLAPSPRTEARTGGSSGAPTEQVWLPRELQPRDSRGEAQNHRRSQGSQELNRMRSRSMSRRSAPAGVEGSLSRLRSRSAHREQDRHSWVQQKQSNDGEDEAGGMPVRDTDSQYGTWETGLRTDDSLTPATPSSDSTLSPSPRKPAPSHTPGDAASQSRSDAVDSFPPTSSPDSQPLSFPDAPVTLLDTSVLRSRAQLAKKRAPRTRPTRAARQSATLTEGGGAEDWLYRDSTAAKVESKDEDSDSEEPTRGGSGSPAVASQPQRVALFPGMDPSALKAQLKKRADSDNQTDGPAPSPSQLSRSPKSPFLPRAARVLPPPGGKENGEEDSPQWLKELKSKKRLSQYESES